MRQRAATAAAFAALALAAAGCGGDDEAVGRSAKLVWEKEPRLLVPPTLPRDRILRGEVKNEGLEKLTMKAADVRVLDADGRKLESVATFVPAYVHSLYPYGRGPGSGPGRYPDEERRRIGLEAEVAPGNKVPFTVSWHDPPGPRTAVEIDYGPGSLDVPARKAR